MNVSTPNINLFDLTPEQLKRAASIKDRIDGLNKQLRGIHIASFANEKSEHERYCEKEDCGYSKSEVGKDSRFDTATASARAAAKKKRMSPTARAQLSAKLKAYWAKKKNQ